MSRSDRPAGQSDERLDHVEPWMLDTAAAMVGVLKAADHFGRLVFDGNGRSIIARRGPDAITVEFDYMSHESEAARA